MLSELIFFENFCEMQSFILFMKESDRIDVEDSDDEKLSQVVLELLKYKGGPKCGA